MNKVEAMPIFKLMRIIRDARSTKGAERHVLNALALRCRPDKGYTAFPSYQTLVADTSLDVATVKRAARKLEAAGVIKRFKRTNRSNIFWINVAALMESADANIAVDKERKEREFNAFMPAVTGDDEIGDAA